MLTPECIERCVSRIALMGFFPASDGNALAIIAEEIAAMCSEDAQAVWLARQFSIAHQKWPGLSELRAFFCQAYKPADGIDANSAIFPDGIPRNLLGTPPSRDALSAGDWQPPKRIARPNRIEGESEVISADPELSALVHDVAEAKTMPPLIQKRSIREIESEIYKRRAIEPRGEIQPSQPGPITEADFEAL